MLQRAHLASQLTDPTSLIPIPINGNIVDIGVGWSQTVSAFRVLLRIVILQAGLSPRPAATAYATRAPPHFIGEHEGSPTKVGAYH
jgi:hypothetical protein